jgi:putative transposase
MYCKHFIDIRIHVKNTTLHYNPVKHGLVTQVADWPHSSFHRYVKNGTYPPDWAGHPDLIDTVGFGE